MREADWLRASAELAEQRPDAPSALRWARAILEREPLALDAHAAVARLLARLEGPDAALRHLTAACNGQPKHCGLLRLRAQHAQHAGEAHVEAAAALVRLEPADAWARRELALALAQANRDAEALAEAREATRIEPLNSAGFATLGHVLRRAGQVAEARAALRQAVRLSADNPYAVASLLELAPTDAERRKELRLVEEELLRQPVTGDGLLVFLDFARPLMEPAALRQWLQRAWQARPDLWHAWAALISEHLRLAENDEALRLAREAVERFPHLPRLWLELAGVHRQRRELDLEIAAAERAFELNPGWPSTALALANALERQDRLEDAQRVLARALTHLPGEPDLRSSHASVLWRLRRVEEALAAVELGLRSNPGHEYSWRVLHAWARETGQPERATRVARALTLDRPGEPRTWLMLARMLAAPADHAEAIAAVDRALALDPRVADAWDLKVELLAANGRFDEALAACEAGLAQCPGDTTSLRGRRAWIEAQRGRLPEAIQQMRVLLAENVGYLWGWTQLAAWSAQRGELAASGEALETALRLRPHDPWLHQRLGQVRLRQQNPAAAQAAFREALRLNPEDDDSAANLFALQFEAREFDAAAATLGLMGQHQPGARTLAHAVTLAARRGDTETALQHFAELCHLPDPEPWPLHHAAESLAAARLEDAVMRTLRAAVPRPEANPQAAATLIELCARKQSPLAAVRLFLKLPPGEAQRRAADRLVLALGELNCPLLLRWLLWRRRDVLFNDDAAWGRTGYALTRFGRARAAADWLANWRQRVNTQPWMHFNHCIMLRQLGRYAEADAIAREVMATRGHQPGVEDFHLLLAVEAAIAGEAAEAAEHLQLAVVREDNRYDRQLRALARALTKFHLLPDEARSERLPDLLAELGKQLGPGFPLGAMRDVRRTFRRAGRALAKAGCGWQVRTWFRWKSAWPWLVAPASLAAAALMGLFIFDRLEDGAPTSGLTFLLAGLVWALYFVARKR